MYRALRGASVILQRHLHPGWQLALLRRQVRHLLFDFDDAVFLRDSYAPKGMNDPRRLRRFAATVRACDAVVAGNAYLADHAARWVGVHRVHLVPTCVDPGRYPLAGHTRVGAGVELVWIGSASTLQGLRLFAPVLELLGRRLPGLRLKVVCDQFLDLWHLPVVPVRWSEAVEAEALAGADVGVSWVPDDAWSRGKCGLKVLQYMAAGLPVVANPVGVQAALVAHGETGYLARTPEQWLQALARLASDPGLRRRFGAAGRRAVESGYSVSAGAARWAEILRGLEAPLARAG